MNRKLAILSTDESILQGYELHDTLLDEPFRRAGWELCQVSWHDKEHDFTKYDAVVVRSTWDYQKHLKDFEETLCGIERSAKCLANPLKLMLWNMCKRYLKEVEAKGVLIVPTTWCEDFSIEEFKQQFEHFGTDEVVIKPTVSAGSGDTFRVSKEQVGEIADKLKECFSKRGFMIQPFLRSIIEEGEFSLFYFGGKFSHAIQKCPAKGDFRVQEEFGATLVQVNAEESLLEAGRAALASIPEPALYARLDFAKIPQGWAVMELELIEPSLYFSLAQGSPERFVSAFLEWHDEQSKSSSSL